CCFAHGRMIGTCHRQLVLLDAGLRLGTVYSFLRTVEPELNDFDALDVPAHRVRLRNGFEKTLDAAALRLGRADVGFDLVERVHSPGLEPGRDWQEEDKRKTKHIGDHRCRGANATGLASRAQPRTVLPFATR